MGETGNLFADLPVAGEPNEDIATLVRTGAMRLARIVSTGQATAADEWYDQDDAEWVVLLQGSAGLRFAGELDVRVLRPGDYVHIPAHVRHRVEWTDDTGPTVWLALHYVAAGDAA